MNRKPKVSKENLQTAKRLLKYVTGTYKVRFVIVFICILLSSIASISVSLSLKFLIDDFISPLIGQKDPNFAELYRALAVLGSIFLMGVIATFTYTRLMVYIGQGVLKKVRDDMFQHMQTLPIRYFDQNTNGSIMSLYTNDTDTLRQMISQSIPQALMSFFTIIVTFISMLILSPLLTILAVLIIGLMIFVTKKIGGNSGKYFVRQQKSLADVTGFVEERMNGQRVVKVFNHERKSEEEFDKLNEALFESAAQANTFANMMGPVIGNIGNLQFVLVSVLGGFLSIMGIGGITLGVMASYLQFTKSFTQPFMQVAQQFNSIVMALAGAERIFALIDEESEKDEGYVTLVNAKKDENGNIIECKERTGMWAWKHPHSADGSVSYTELTGDVRFEDVTFGYNEDKVILKDISLFAKPGQKLAFVGSTGAGKTTITNLINRFYDIQEGKIRYDGINITKIKKDDLRRSLGIVLQDTHLFTGTIMDNIRYGKLDATDEKVYEAAKLAHADQFIKMLPKGYDTMLSGDGEELSQGQRQLLSIARAAVANPPVLILDEATSSIDTRTESIVQKGMDNLMKGRTVFVIAHRLSTIRNSDAIIVLEHGKIIERGDHADLIKMKGTYYQLYTGKLELS
ncbi:ABC transporter ATP-binding protein [Mediterraneibacter gnavus]|uniref:ABC transporter ATP-binding protein n=1 Tax=Mediterraneibacter gnavus TaxID=33038 RepID=A0AB36DGT4_MEDGN|nr:ABC transporter ATP-binding protein [Mediterraneibacter gnavus]NSI65186.1 ABC transporter ATP-binding protein [Mediterraneibacter gnavus]